jgi:hypothetical protein
MSNHEDYPTMHAWLEAERDAAEIKMIDHKGAFEAIRDDFIALPNPTREQAEFYQKVERAYHKVVAAHRSHVRTLDAALRLYGQNT